MVDKCIKFTVEAKLEFYRAKCFFEFNGFEDSFWSDVDRQLKLVLDFPFAFQVRYRDVRIVNLERFNYSIHYVAKPDGILVYRFLNQKQDF